MPARRITRDSGKHTRSSGRDRRADADFGEKDAISWNVGWAATAGVPGGLSGRDERAVFPVSVSVVIVNWNSGALLEECLRAIAVQTRLPDATFVVDNGSTDESARCAENFPHCVLLSPGRNLGFAGGNNLALRQCATDYILLVNPDAFLTPNCIETLVATAEANPGFAAFGTRQMRHGDLNTVDGVGDSYHVSGKVARCGHGRVLGDADMIAEEIFSPCAAAAMYRRSALADVGYFDEDYFCFVEDVDLGFRLRLRGYRALYVPGAVVSHVGSGTTGGRRSEFSTYYGQRNLVWTFVKNMPSPLFWFLLPLHVLVNILAVIWCLAGGRGMAALRAKFDAIRGLGRALAKRRYIQERRRVALSEIWRVLDKRLF